LALLTAPFDKYQLDTAYDEMFDSSGGVRPHYEPLFDMLRYLPADKLRHFKHEIDLMFLNQGVTFTVYGREERTERILPHDLLPRMVTHKEWTQVERGLEQRITALNLFLKDLYHEGKILSDGVVPRELVYTSKYFRRQMRGLSVPRGVYIAVTETA